MTKIISIYVSNLKNSSIFNNIIPYTSVLNIFYRIFKHVNPRFFDYPYIMIFRQISPFLDFQVFESQDLL